VVQEEEEKQFSDRMWKVRNNLLENYEEMHLMERACNCCCLQPKGEMQFEQIALHLMSVGAALLQRHKNLIKRLLAQREAIWKFMRVALI